MYGFIPNRSMLLATALSCCFLAATTALADEDDNGQGIKTVNCNGPNASVQNAINSVRHGRQTTIFIVGFCDESVSIVKDGITLSGNKNGYDAIGGGLTEVIVTGAQRVKIEYLELTGDGYGVLVQEGSSVTIRNNNIHDNVADGVGATNHVFARIEFNRITGNGRIDQGEGGIDALVGASVRSRGNYIADNAYAAVEAGNMSYIRSDGGDIILQKGCSDNEPAGSGITCGDEGTVAVDCYRNGMCDFRGTHVTGYSLIFGLSNLDARNSTFNGDIDADGGSRLHLRSSVTGSGRLICDPFIDEAFASSFYQCGDQLLP
jgi:hypothetical protein